MSDQPMSGNKALITWSDGVVFTPDEAAKAFQETCQSFTVTLGKLPIERKLERLYARQCHRWAIMRLEKRR
jgi:hypothetical protein